MRAVVNQALEYSAGNFQCVRNVSSHKEVVRGPCKSCGARMVFDARDMAYTCVYNVRLTCANRVFLNRSNTVLSPCEFKMKREIVTGRGVCYSCSKSAATVYGLRHPVEARAGSCDSGFIEHGGKN